MTMPLLPDWLARSAAAFPTKLAVRCGAMDWTFAELDRHATRLARRLARAGVQPRQNVVAMVGNGLPFVALVHALARLGAVLVPLNLRLTPAEMRWQIQDAQATAILYDVARADLAIQIAGDLPVIDLDLAFYDAMAQTEDDAEIPLRATIDLAATQAIIYTSGTTGQPKGAIITFGMQWWNATGSALNLGHDPSDRWLAVLPFFHIGGLTILWRSVILGIGVVVHERFDAAAVNRSLWEDEVTIISVVAVMAQRMLDDLGDGAWPQRLRCLLLGGGPAPLPLLQACAARHVPVVQTYGMTESCSQAATLAPADALRKLGSAGRPLLPVRLRIVTESGDDAAPGEAGEIWLAGPTITPGYFNRPDATARAFRDGWFATGDLGMLDSEGFLTVLDRRADLIVSGGENIYPAEIEAALLAHPAVAEAGVTGVPDATWGQVPIAFVHLRGEAIVTSDDLLAFLTERLARYKLPRAIVVVPDPLPRNAAGKLLRRELLQDGLTL
jgi:o-succinylbenzoate---CoA ligase